MNNKTKNLLTTLQVHEEGDRGRLYIDAESKLYISTTSLISLYEDKTGLNAWIERLGEEEANAQRDAAGDRGTLAHNQIEHYLNTGEIKSEFSKFSINAIEGFYKNVEIVSAEEQIAYDDGYVRFAGRFDQLLRLKPNTFYLEGSDVPLSDKLVICDLKTKKVAKPLNTQTTFRALLQASAYIQAKEHLDNIEIDGAVIVFVSPRTCKKIYLSREDIKKYWEIYHLLLLDYFDIKPLTKSWNYYMASIEFSFNAVTGTIESYAPSILL